MILAHNISAMNTNRQLGINQKKLINSSSKLASGYRITKAADDAAGLAISEKMCGQIRGLNRASENVLEGISLIQTADGAMHEVHNILQRMEELSVQAANDTNTDVDRLCIQEEISNLIDEIDRIAETTQYNSMNLLDGTWSSTENSSVKVWNVSNGVWNTLGQQNSQNALNIVYTEVTNDVITIQTPVGGTTMSGSGVAALKSDLKQEIVPQAVQKILNTYKNTFGYLKGSSIGIGLELYNKPSSSTLASVTMGVSGALNSLNVTYKLSVNLATLSFDSTGNLTAASRDELEVTIIHEMTHALMDEVLSNGMLGYNGGTGFSASLRFPSWFVEGMAQASAGGCFNGNDWVNSGLGITAAMDIATIKSRLSDSGFRLDSGSTAADYGTGYLACMYLGYIANGGGAIRSAGMANGLDKIMNEVKSGTSLDAAIAKYTSYSGLNDFQSKFADDAAPFVHNLVSTVGSGSGGLVSGFTTSVGFLPDVALANASDANLFALNINNDTVSNSYPAGYPVLEGGTRIGTGVSGPGTYILSKGGLGLQIGANAGQLMEIRIDSVSSMSIGVSSVDVFTREGAQEALDSVQYAIEVISAQRSRLGAYQNRLEHAVTNADNMAENLQASESLIRDLDMADEMVRFSATNILAQSGQAMLAQANRITEGMLGLLK